MKSSDLLEYVKEAKPSGDIRDAFATVILWMTNREMIEAGLWPQLNQMELLKLREKNKIGAVKDYKRRCGCSLMDAKNRVEDAMRVHYGVTSFFDLEKNKDE